ncbi:heavy metal translocating P-type ATPase [Endomicrobium proavitum]|uniref:P-type Zn(2+) transporter n=1 Tax=Endomicrobium proavitum TaxID=1408281 RepID=A0A0G3WLI4_9BACT|nr:heavy metal translocating P-type ATPase [Endomicrobium proavitum]AKL98364.1 Cadmium, zinc and cobalt-transporting ATPase [Endomicrobium proavitum]
MNNNNACCESGCHCSKEKESKHSKKIDLALTIIGVFLFAAAFIFAMPEKISLVLFLSAYTIIGRNVLISSFKNILHGEIFDENFLMCVATIAAISTGYYEESVAVMLFYRIGMFFEDKAVSKSKNSISSLMDMRPDFANLQTQNGVIKVSPEDVSIGNLIIVKAGEKIPLDGTVTNGSASIDASSLTGESILQDVCEGSQVLSGSVNKNGFLTVKVTKIFSQSTVSKILDLVENATHKKSVSEKFISKFAKYYTPAVVFLALCIAVVPPLFIADAAFNLWINKAIIFLIISCPCALVISVPLTFFAGLGSASKHGILIKGSNYLEALNSAQTFVFDKTSTLTKGKFKVDSVAAANGFDKETVLKYAAFAESHSNHPAAVAIVKAFAQKIDNLQIKNFSEIAGKGIKADISGKEVLAGNYNFLQSEGIDASQHAVAQSAVYVAIDKKFAGFITVADEIKPDSKETVSYLKNLYAKKTVMLTGDAQPAAFKIAETIGIDKFYAGLLPHQKLEKLNKIKNESSKKDKIVFVGDGINDAPVLAGADIGIAMGALGSDAAIEAADIVLMTDEPSKIITALKIARKTQNVVWQNIIFALGIKVVIMALGITGIANMVEAVFGDVGVTVIAVLNSMRALKLNDKK